MVSGGEEISHKCPGSSQFGNDDKEGDFHQFQNGKHVALSCLMKMGKEWGPKKNKTKTKQELVTISERIWDYLFRYKITY